MNLREGILDALIDDDESIVQIKKYLNYVKIEFDRIQVIKQLEQLLIEEKITIQYPPKFRGTQKLNIKNIEDYWFGITETGKEEWRKIDSP